LLFLPANIAWLITVSGVENTAATNGQMHCFCFFRAFAPIFDFNFAIFVGGGAKIFFGAGYPSYATVVRPKARDRIVTEAVNTLAEKTKKRLFCSIFAAAFCILQ